MNELKRQVNQHLSRIGKALASPHRLELIELLAQREQSVEALARSLGVPLAMLPTTSARSGRPVSSSRATKGRSSSIDWPTRTSFRLARMIRVLGERHIAEVDRVVRKYFDSRDELEPIDARELLERARSGDVVLLDARPAAEYRAGHLPGAVSIPVEEIEQHLSELPPNKEVVAYCRGPYCVMALDAVRKLRASGRKARRFAEGYPEWRAAGLPTEASVEA
jgi:rhodanese-related sulfurtransferase